MYYKIQGVNDIFDHQFFNKEKCSLSEKNLYLAPGLDFTSRRIKDDEMELSVGDEIELHKPSQSIENEKVFTVYTLEVTEIEEQVDGDGNKFYYCMTERK